jgi:3-isopropylmalate/(R)-2-methylmalate dehydratase large subunit
MKTRTIFDKLWDAHRIRSVGSNLDLLYIDRIFLHERTGGIALQSLLDNGRSLANPPSVFVTMDHIVDTRPEHRGASRMPGGDVFLEATRAAAMSAGAQLFDINDARQGIVHVVSPEQGIALPGITLVCPDSHTCTIGGLGALAWGIGTTEAEHALATQTLCVTKPSQMRVRFEGQLAKGVSAKDLILFLIGKHGAAGGAGCVVEFAGSAVRALEIESRLTLCNMAIEFGAWTGLVAPDDTTIDYVNGRHFTPKGRAWDAAVDYWRTIISDDAAEYDQEILLDASSIRPQVTWGTNPQQVIAVDEPIPQIRGDSGTQQADSNERALSYMGLTAGQSLAGLTIDAAFIGSCTNSRISDLREAAKVLRGRHVAVGLRAVCVPGSSEVARQAQQEGLDKPNPGSR